MPVHDWTRVDAGLFHAFHHRWISSLCSALNGGGLPEVYFALPEQNIRGPIPDVLALKLAAALDSDAGEGGVAVAMPPPKTKIVRRSESSLYADKADYIAVRHRHGEVVAVIEIVSPGNKGSKSELRAFVEKATSLLRHKVHLMVVDLFPPSKRDPQGMHQAIWGEFGGDEDEYELPADKPLTLSSYDAGPPQLAYVETVGVGDPLPEMPLYLRPEAWVPTPLEETYRASWEVFPKALPGIIAIVREIAHAA